MLEEEIDKHLFSMDEGEAIYSILHWAWNGLPFAFEYVKDKDIMTQIHELIQKTPLELCLTSPSEYVREYRKWYMEKNNA